MQGIRRGALQKCQWPVLGARAANIIYAFPKSGRSRGVGATATREIGANVEDHRECRTGSDAAELLAFGGWASYDFRLVLSA